MHYLLQITLAELEAATKQVLNPETFNWEQAWAHQGGLKYIGQYTEGQALISGPIAVGNPNKPWFEVIASKPEVIDALSALASESMPMHEAVTSRGPMRAAYKATSRRRIRNAGGKPVGVLCDFTIYGIDPVSSSLGGRDPEDMTELLDLE